MSKWMTCVVSVCALSLAVGTPGCRSKQSKAERQALLAEALRQEVEAQFSAILDLQAQGQTEDAMKQLEQGFANKKYAAYRPRFFAQKVDLLLAQDKADEAGGLILKTWAKEPQLAQSVFGRIRAYHQEKQDHAAILAWCKQLLGMGKTLPAHLSAQVLDWQLSAATATDDPAAIAEAVSQIIAGLSPEKAVPLLQQVIQTMISAKKFDQVSGILACITTHKNGTAQAYKDLAATSSLKCLIAQEAWDKVPEAFETCAAQLDDDALQKLLSQTATTLQKNQQLALLEKIGQRVIQTCASKEKSVGYAARIWVGIGMETNKGVLPERLTALLDAKVQAEQVAMLLEHYFYVFVEDRDTIKKLCVIGERTMNACTDKETKDSLKVKLMDGAFIVEDYDLVLQMLESGIPDKPKEWHDMSIPKVKAHRALAQNKPQDAIVFFREFMKVLDAVGPEEEHDPTTGVAYSKEWILGRNAHRIATIHESVSDTANAAKARAEAKALFAKALEKAEKDDDTLKQLKAEMKEMGF